MDVYHLVLLLTNIFDCYVIMKFMRIFFPPDSINRKAAAVIYTIRYIAVSAVSIFMPYPALSLAVSLTALFMVTFCYSSKLPQKITAAFSAYMVMFASELIVAAVVGISNVSPVARTDQGSSFCVIVSELIALVIVTLLSNFIRTDKETPVSWSFFFTVLIVSAVTVFLEIQIFMQKNISDMTYALSMICILMLNFIIFYLYDSISASFKEKMKSRLAQREIDYYHHQAELIQRNSQELKHFRHDMKNRLIAVSQLISQGKNEDALKYISSITDKMTAIELYSETGCIPVDSIINYKLSLAAERGINIKTNIILPEDIETDPDDMFIIFGNLLDNGTEACDKINGDKYISLDIRYERGAIIICMKNSFDSKVIKQNEKFLTTKNDPLMHGLGLSSIEAAVKKHSGEINMTYDKNNFETNIIMFA